MQFDLKKIFNINFQSKTKNSRNPLKNKKLPMEFISFMLKQRFLYILFIGHISSNSQT